jgi:hypothetical protein
MRCLEVDLNSVYEVVLAAMMNIDGDATVLDERCIVLTRGIMQGVVVLEPEGQVVIRVYTPWRDADGRTVERAEDIPDTLTDLFQNFWNRRRTKNKE